MYTGTFYIQRFENIHSFTLNIEIFVHTQRYENIALNIAYIYIDIFIPPESETRNMRNSDTASEPGNLGKMLHETTRLMSALIDLLILGLIISLIARYLESLFH
jgi:hypothetical protein